MKKDKILFMLMLSIFVFQSLSSPGQTIETEDSRHQKIINAAREITNSASICALITNDEDGRARARAMEFIGPEEDFTIWFGTNPKSRKVDQIMNDPRVSIYFTEAYDSGYVMYYGIAELVDDAQIKKSKWKPGWEAFYPDQDENFLLIKVIPEWIEVVSYKHGLVGDSITWEPPMIHFDTK
jgi:general stress protein 26